MWEVIKEMVRAGTTLLLTTQYLEEADRLANEIVVIDHGRSIARGTADQLKSQIGGERVELVIASRDDLSRARETLTFFAVGEVMLDEQTRTLTAPVSGGSGVLTEVLRGLDSNSIGVLDVGLRRPTLDDVFLTLTGHVAEKTESVEAELKETA
jgi:ABC-2 type transport system ATP-binding protein